MTNSNEKKMTKRDYFNLIKKVLPENVSSYEGIVQFVDHELALLEKKNSSDKKPTAQQVENGKIKNAIYNGMTENRLYTITEMQKEIPDLAELSNQRISALVKQMLADNLVTRTEEKRKAYFTKVI